MVIIRIKGGLGNQMFQFATAYSLSKNLSTTMDIDTTYYPLSNHNNFELKKVYGLNNNQLSFNKVFSLILNRTIFFIESKFNIKVLNTHIFSEEDLDNEIHCENDSLILDGYFQSEKYFIKHRKDLIKLFSFPKLFGRNLKIQSLVKKSNTCSIHIRRGDYITNLGAIESMARIDKDYYQKAKAYMEKNVKNIKFLYFSDDIKWVRNEFQLNDSDVVVDWNNGNNSYIDMQLMSLCRHNIVANSSFSWWGAWLNKGADKIVIAPKKWFNNADLNSKITPNNWIKF